MGDYSRVHGIVSNFETDKIVQSMIKPQKLRLDRVKADRQILDWKREGYRDVASLLKGFESSFFDLLNRENNMRLRSNYSSYEPVVKLGSKSTEAVSVDLESAANFNKININEISQLATSETWEANKEIKQIEGSVDLDKLNAALAAADGNPENIANKHFSLNVDGKNTLIELASSYSSVDEFKADLQTKINAKYGEGVVRVGLKDEKINIDGNAHKITVGFVSEETSQALGIKGGDSNYFNAADTLETLLGVNDNITLKMKTSSGKVDEIKLKSSDSIVQVIDKINNSQNNFKISLDSVKGRFKLITNETGAVNTIEMADDATKDFFAKLGLTEDTRVRGQNARVVVNGEEVISASNEININGAKIKLNQLHKSQDGDIEITRQFEPKKMVEKMKKFVEKYNELVSKLNGLTNEKKNRKFQPLTDEEKKEMKKEEITEWEKKAKEGLFRNDPIIRNLLSDMRRAFNTAVEGSGITMDQLGLDFSNDRKEPGKLIFNEAKFTKALEEKTSSVLNFFTSKSEIAFDTVQDDKRFSQNGVMERLNDIFKFNTSTTILRNKQRGHLVDMAGIKGTASEHTSKLSERIKRVDWKVDDMMRALVKKENEYYLKFANLEKALARISSQSNAFSGLM